MPRRGPRITDPRHLTCPSPHALPRYARRYVFLAASSSFKGKSDLKKYEKARKLKKCIGKVRRWMGGLSSGCMRVAERALSQSVLW